MNLLSETYDSLKSIEANGKIVEAMTTVTDDEGRILELKPTTSVTTVVNGADVITEVPNNKDDSNIYEVYTGTYNIIKLLHAKKNLVCNYVKGATEADDTITYDIIVRYNKTNNTTDKTVLSSINATPFFSIKSAERGAQVTGELNSSSIIEVSWDKLSALTDPSDYTREHNKFYDAVKASITATKPFSS
jgi:hypothetical protein